MLHCMRDDSYRKSSIAPVAFEGEQDLRPFNNSAISIRKSAYIKGHALN